MRRLLAIVAFLAGGIAAEMTHPVLCHLIVPARVQVKRRRQ
ncbi:hypothetical protein AWB68_00236 [Caballeronia choica]|uniref:Uncharacterized protein n=1 Tax=Caballeronia choica TaxID=326476 RepID=A0A158F3F6_9BURK|nr:hypothetical protein [Caballeronia choica]SAL14255.1 hypothetical protein AWB68_00236 [Caballeronia choica]